MSEHAGRYQRSFGGMVGSLIVLLVIVGAFVVVRALNSSDPTPPRQTVEYLQAVPYYKSEADFPLVAPKSLPTGWRATSQRFVDAKPQSWHLGSLTAADHYVGLEQASTPRSAMVEQYVDADAKRGADVTIAGQTWQSWSDSGGDHALVRRADGVTTLVVGSGTLGELTTFVGLLR